ncbi:MULTISPECIES: hypothetical protein [Myxococcus]|uniref:Lipoprotein n=1 Tax=Myxococcus virescens TaxID=83456 RepID=A0A511H5G8_9BACT|nr:MULTISPECIES: hypothetical protein [Myxococcus]WNZ65485.1 hypothetical protein QEG98_18785 [Myxococcus sp. MxC21-1]GEL68767.1 hypothetical protein MVI01_05510 [Myxococcus virescens]SDE47973.1 hypothetical protein SAMN04488504_107197 [Myxococcus virescens]
MPRYKQLILLGLMTSGALAGCASSKSAEQDGAGAVRGRQAGEPIRPEAGANEEVTQQDANGDGRPDVWTYTVDGRKVRQELDLNWDGRVDLTRYFDANGDKARESLDLDFDGRVDATYFHEKGVNTRRERDTNGDGRPDSFTYYEGGKLVRKERDTRGAGRIDYWEYWEGGQVDRIGEDLDGDGTVDKWTRNPNNAARE